MVFNLENAFGIKSYVIEIEDVFLMVNSHFGTDYDLV